MQWVSGATLSGGKAAGAEADHLPSSDVKIKKHGTVHSHVCLDDWMLN
jgi:hypothetical protein